MIASLRPFTAQGRAEVQSQIRHYANIGRTWEKDQSWPLLEAAVWIAAPAWRRRGALAKVKAARAYYRTEFGLPAGAVESAVRESVAERLGRDQLTAAEQAIYEAACGDAIVLYGTPSSGGPPKKIDASQLAMCSIYRSNASNFTDWIASPADRDHVWFADLRLIAADVKKIWPIESRSQPLMLAKSGSVGRPRGTTNYPGDDAVVKKVIEQCDEGLFVGRGAVRRAIISMIEKNEIETRQLADGSTVRRIQPKVFKLRPDLRD